MNKLKKNILFSAITLLAALTVDAGSLDDFMLSHKDHEESMYLNFGGSFFSGDDEAEDKFEGLTIFSCPSGPEGLVSNKEIGQLKKDLKKDDLELYMQVDDKDSHIEFFIREKKKKIEKAIMLIENEESLFIMEIRGEFKVEDLQSIDMDVDGSEKLKKIK